MTKRGQIFVKVLLICILAGIFSGCSIMQNNRVTQYEENESNVNNRNDENVKQKLIGYWQNTGDGSTTLDLDAIPDEYDIIYVAFAESFDDNGILVFEPKDTTPGEFINHIRSIQKKNKKVVLSVRGQDGILNLETLQDKRIFVRSIVKLIDKYGFDGVNIDIKGESIALEPEDIDFRTPTTPSIVYLIEALKEICSKYGSGFFLSMSPEIAGVQGGMAAYQGIYGAYLPIIHAMQKELTVLHVKHYNCGSAMGIDGNIYEYATADFHVAMAELLLQGFGIAGQDDLRFQGISQDKLAFGVPSNTNASDTGYTDLSDMKRALQYLISGKSYGGQYKLFVDKGYENLYGVMTWSVNWDAPSGNQFASGIEEIFQNMPEKEK